MRAVKIILWAGGGSEMTHEGPRGTQKEQKWIGSGGRFFDKKDSRKVMIVQP